MIKYVVDKIFLVKESDVMQTCIAVKVERGEKVVGTRFSCNQISEELHIARLDYKLHVAHERIAELDIFKVHLWA